MKYLRKASNKEKQTTITRWQQWGNLTKKPLLGSSPTTYTTTMQSEIHQQWQKQAAEARVKREEMWKQKLVVHIKRVK